MECAALFAIALRRGVQSGAVLAVDGNVLQTAESMDTYQPHRDEVSRATDATIRIALRALAQTLSLE
jgi:uridine phosphorylase